MIATRRLPTRSGRIELDVPVYMLGAHGRFLFFARQAERLGFQATVARMHRGGQDRDELLAHAAELRSILALYAVALAAESGNTAPDDLAAMAKEALG